MTVVPSSALLPHAAIVGGSLGGLAAARALSQTGWSVDVYERSPTELSQKGSGLGFVHVPAWESLTQRPMIRRQVRASRAQGSYFYGDLWSYLYQRLLEEEETVKVHFGQPITELHGTVEAPVIHHQNYDLVVLADGGFSALRHHVLGERAKPEYAGYVVWRGSVAVSKLPSHLRRDLKHVEGVYKNGIYDTIVLKMAKDNGDDIWTMGTFVATPESDLARYNWNKDKDGKSRHGGISDNNNNKPSVVPDWFLEHMTQQFPHLVPLMEQMMQQGEIQPHPQYEFGNIDKVHKGRVLLLGDAAHMASPRTAVGAHTAILDALALRDAMEHLQENDDLTIDNALDLYSREGLAHARQLYARTREVSQDFVPKGNLDKLISPEELYRSSTSTEKKSA
ncbi:hydroxynicotinate 3-monooxygenase [Seminavis robusta]|uniref:Hydroxynicotinate 3-monooxygenase n=1 Tax=Seminavis robusta TaxID=568900 RepID=A0A9N8EZS1_9STRA|nr:hydroxynicotinate 3-monooxygenase [Seminavis robusta]|eukprot:Sro2657_g333870.1 hydroxynicotinate 3-monooxygenase (394) ;mRNA; f:10409-11590